MKQIIPFVSIAAFTLFSACSNLENPKGHQPIVLGDSATIVTEHDSQYLHDIVLDISTKNLTDDTVATPVAARAEIPDASSVAVIPKEGFEIDFGNFKALITGIETKEFRNQNPQKDPDVSYKVVKGDLINSSLILSGLKDIQIQERYQSHLILKKGADILELNKLGTYTSDWSPIPLKQTNGQSEYDLKSLGALKFKQVSNASLRSAVQNELRSKRANEKTIREWNQQLAKVSSIPNPLAEVVLDNVQWRISGKDSKGNTVSKLIRIDH